MQNQIENAIMAAVKEHGQPPDLAKKITAWMKALSAGNETIDDGQSALQRVSVLYDVTSVPNAEESE